MRNPKPNASCEWPQSRFWRRTSGLLPRIAGCLLIFAAATLSQSVRADITVLDDNFNNASNNIANNSDGIGDGFTTLVPQASTYTWALETNGTVSISSDINGAYRGIFDSIDAIPVNGGGTVFEFRNVSFTNQPNNTSTGGTDRTVLAVTATNTAGDWLESGTAGIPAGFWIQFMSDGEASGTGNGSPVWDGNSSLFYDDGMGNRTVLYTWVFDTLKWGPTVVSNYAPVLDVKLTLSGSGFAFSIAGDTASGAAIGVTNSYVNAGITDFNLLNGLNNAYMGGESQTENPGLIMSVDRILATELGNLIVSTPRIATPEYGYNTNVLYAGEALTLSSTVLDSSATPTLQWQVSDASNPGAFTNLPAGNATNVTVNTSGFGDSNPRYVQIVATDGVNPPVTNGVYITVNPASAPSLVQDVPSGPLQITAGATLSIPTLFTGNQPMTNAWKFSLNGVTYSSLATQTNNTLVIRGVSAGNSGYYQLFVTNAVGYSFSSIIQIQVVPPTPIYPFPGSYGSYALYTNVPYAFWQLNETNDPSSGFVQAFDYSGNGHAGTYRNGAQDYFNGILAPQPPTYPGFAANQGALLVGGGSATNTLVVIPPLNVPTNITDTTISAWIYPNTAVQANAAVFATRSTIAGHVEAIEFTGSTLANGLRTLGYNWNDSATAYNWNSQLAPPLNTWSFVVLVVQTNGATLYLNYIDPNSGQPVLESAFNAQTCHPETFLDGTNFLGTTLIGDDVYAANRTFPGQISDLALYHAALSQSQVQKMFSVALGVSGFPASVVTQPPSTISTYAGFPVTIAAAASGTGTLTNRWQYNGVNLTDGAFAGTVISGSSTPVLTVQQATSTLNNGVFTLTTTNALGGNVSSSATLTVLTPVAPVGVSLLGQWVAGSPNFKDVSGYSAPGEHDGYLVGNKSFYFTNDVPPVAPYGAVSLHVANTGLAITNSSTLDSAYDGLFDNGISNAMSVTFWAKGWPGGWNAFVSKYGEGPGWQVRNDGADNTSPAWTMRFPSASRGTVALGTAVYGDAEDLAATSLNYGNDGQWHYYAAVYDVSTGIRSLYVDGNLAAQATGVGQYNTAAAEHLAIGTKDSPPGNSFGGNFTGLFYDVRIYNESLGQDQQAYVGVNTLPAPPGVNAPKYVPGTGFVLSWYGGTLEESTNLAGPWVTNAVQTSPITNALTNPQEFFRVIH